MGSEVPDARLRLAPVRKVAEWLTEVIQEGACTCDRCLRPTAYQRRGRSAEVPPQHTLVLDGRQHHRRFALSTGEDAKAVLAKAFSVFHKNDSAVALRARTGTITLPDVLALVPGELWPHMAAVLVGNAFLHVPQAADAPDVDRLPMVAEDLMYALARALGEAR